LEEFIRHRGTRTRKRTSASRPHLCWILAVFWSLGFLLVLKLTVALQKSLPPIPTFLDSARQAGLTHVMVSGDAKEKRFLVESVGGGLAILDYDNDGWMDLYIVNGGTIESQRAGEGSKFPAALYRNMRDGTFTNVTKAAKLVNRHWGKGVLAADFNNDGFTDLYLCNFGPNVLLQNNGDGTFSDITARAGVGDPRWSSAAAAADYDRDGDLDLFVANYLDYDLNHLPVLGKFCSYRGIPVACGPRGLKGAGDMLYRNNGDGTFSDVSSKAGVDDVQGLYGLGAVWGDFDDDGDADLCVANDTTPNLLYRNNGDGTFTDVAPAAGVAFSEDGRAQAGMGIELEDLDNDGRLDIFVTNFSDDWNTLRLNKGQGIFEDATVASGIGAEAMHHLGWGTGFCDFNNDGFKDIFVANGHIYPQVDRYGLRITYRQQNKLYLNTGEQRLLNVSNQAGTGLQIVKSWRGAAFADFNNDGNVDIAVAALDETPSLLMNQGVAGYHWIQLHLVGTQSNRNGVGARVSVACGEVKQVREVKAGGSFASSNDPRVHFGLGKAARIDELVVRWPSGRITTLRDIKGDQSLTVKE
jgi:enediyne biosynthesis protein E4